MSQFTWRQLPLWLHHSLYLARDVCPFLAKLFAAKSYAIKLNLAECSADDCSADGALKNWFAFQFSSNSVWFVCFFSKFNWSVAKLRLNSHNHRWLCAPNHLFCEKRPFSSTLWNPNSIRAVESHVVFLFLLNLWLDVHCAICFYCIQISILGYVMWVLFASSRVPFEFKVRIGLFSIVAWHVLFICRAPPSACFRLLVI